MKITKRQLKRIIREEKQKILTEEYEEPNTVWTGDTPGGIMMTFFVGGDAGDGEVYMEVASTKDEWGYEVGGKLFEFPKSEIPHIIANLQAMLQA